MDQTEQGGQDSRESAPGSSQQSEPARASRDLDGTWGLGSASALDSLRRQNFRGRRQSGSSEDKPSSD